MENIARNAAPRLAPLGPPYTPEVGEALAAMMPSGVPPLGLFRTLAHNPRVLEKVRAGNLLDRGSLERRDREIAILRTCARCGSEYEWGVHVSVFSARVGISEEKVTGTVVWNATDSRWEGRERAIVELVDQLHETAQIDDALWSRLEASFAADQIVELIVLIGFYHTISFVTNGLGVDREAGSARFPSSTAGARFPSGSPV